MHSCLTVECITSGLHFSVFFMSSQPPLPPKEPPPHPPFRGPKCFGGYCCRGLHPGIPVHSLVYHRRSIQSGIFRALCIPPPCFTVLQLYLTSHKPVLRFAAVRLLSKVCGFPRPVH